VGFHVFGAVLVFGTMQQLILELRVVEATPEQLANDARDRLDASLRERVATSR
jgi:hypothetical protein